MVKHRFTVEDYHKAYAAGALGQGRVELINGEVYIMSPMGNKHRRYIGAINYEIVTKLKDKAYMFCQVPIQLDDRSEPEPDFILTVPPASRYDDRPPGPADILLVIEVSDSTLVFDRTVKLPLYIRAGIPEIWIVNLLEEKLEVYRAPDYHPIYFDKGTAVAPLAFGEDRLEWWV